MDEQRGPSTDGRWPAPPPAWGPPPPPAWGPPPTPAGRPPISALAIAGLVTSLFCCAPIGVGLTIGGHLQVRRGLRRGRWLVITGYVAAALVSVSVVVFTTVGVTDLRGTTNDYVGDWRSTDELAPVTLELRGEAFDTSLGGMFDLRQGGLGCFGTVEERSRSEDEIRIELDGTCDGSVPYTRPMTLRRADDGTLRSHDGLTFRRTG